MNLSERLRSGDILYMRADVTHARRGALRHSFRYRTDYLLLAPDHATGPRLFSRNRFNLLAVHDRDHGGERGEGEGVPWARARFEEAGLPMGGGMLVALLTQPRLLGHWFTPVSFWMAIEGDDVRAVIAEVNNTFGQRHCYLCCLEDFPAIAAADSIVAPKVFHVSPFQDVSGLYTFRFSVSAARIAIRIGYDNDGEGLDAAMRGALVPLTSVAALKACLLAPGGGLRVLALIYWNALRLKLKGARYRPLPPSPQQDLTR